MRNASVRSASPASIATASPNTLWQVGLPRLISSLSMLGRSSCMSEYVCIISMEQASGSRSSLGFLFASQAAIASMGLILLPLEKSIYSIASRKIPGVFLNDEKTSFNEFSTIIRLSCKYVPSSITFHPVETASFPLCHPLF